jgi:hypothetical protein
MCITSTARSRLRHECACLLLVLLQAANASSKYACDYSNRLCQWNARYMFGATVLGDKVCKALLGDASGRIVAAAAAAAAQAAGSSCSHSSTGLLAVRYLHQQQLIHVDAPAIWKSAGLSA